MSTAHRNIEIHHVDLLLETAREAIGDRGMTFPDEARRDNNVVGTSRGRPTPEGSTRTMTTGPDHFPAEIRALPDFEGPFDAHRLEAESCDVLFASYPAGTEIEPHTHDTDNVGVVTAGRLDLSVGGVEASFGPGEWYRVAAGVEHSARFATDTAEIEFWFRR